MKFAEVDWKAVRRAAESDGVALIPLGSLEAHGPHLPCGTDTFQINEIVRRAVEKVPQPDRVIVYPTIEYTITEWASPFAAACISPKALMDDLIDIARAVYDLGFRKIVFTQGHAGLPAMQMASCWQLRYEHRYALYVDTHPYVMAAGEVAKLTGETAICHGGTTETAMMLAIRPDLMHRDRIVDGPTDPWGASFPFPSIRGRPGASCLPTVEVLADCVEGRASLATPEMGERVLDLYAGALAKVLAELLAGPVPKQYLRPFKKPLV